MACKVRDDLGDGHVHWGDSHKLGSGAPATQELRTAGHHDHREEPRC